MAGLSQGGVYTVPLCHTLPDKQRPRVPLACYSCPPVWQFSYPQGFRQLSPASLEPHSAPHCIALLVSKPCPFCRLLVSAREPPAVPQHPMIPYTAPGWFLCLSPCRSARVPCAHSRACRGAASCRTTPHNALSLEHSRQCSRLPVPESLQVPVCHVPLLVSPEDPPAVARHTTMPSFAPVFLCLSPCTCACMPCALSHAYRGAASCRARSQSPRSGPSQGWGCGPQWRRGRGVPWWTLR